MRRSARPASVHPGLACLAALAAAGLAMGHASPPAGAQAGQAAEKPAQAKPAKSTRPAPAAATSAGEQAILVLVNDEPITAYEVEQRARLNSLSANIGAAAQERFKAIVAQESTSQRLRAILEDTIKSNPGKTKEQVLAIFEGKKKEFAMGLQKQALDSARAAAVGGQRKGALDELIDERLKLQEAKRLNVIAEEAEVDRIIKSIADRNKVTTEQFAQNVRSMGADVAAMRARYKATLSWNEVIRRRFGHQVSVAQRDIDRFVSKGPGGEDQVELKLQRIVVTLGGTLDQKQVAERLQAAEAAKARFNGCKGMRELTKGLGASRFEDLGDKRLGTIPEPTRSLLANSKDGEMLPPSVGQEGVELWAVCGRKVVKGSEEKVAQAKDELRQREFELLSQRHLKDLRQDASICYRSENKGC
jgi:peptidyl-prolyl cis-trans isomerase SurA